MENDLKKYEDKCPLIVILDGYMDIGIPLDEKWEDVIRKMNDSSISSNLYLSILVSYIEYAIAISNFNMTKYDNILIKKIVFDLNDFLKRYQNEPPIVINDLGYNNDNQIELNPNFHTVRIFGCIKVYGLIMNGEVPNKPPFLKLKNNNLFIGISCVTYI